MMKFTYSLLLTAIFPLSGLGQQIGVVNTLESMIDGTSGLIYLNQKLITHNDSGGEPALYEIDSISGLVTRKVYVANATNVDWEDICYDSTYIYVADFGNNSGSRTDLKIYRIPISGYIQADTVMADTLRFSYADQKRFTPDLYKTNFDAEALISYGDHLYIFTKNWGNYWTYVYELPKVPGNYQLEMSDSINAQGLVTGATYNPMSNTILLTGYTFTAPFIIEISSISSDPFSKGSIRKYMLELQSGSSSQIESIATVSQNKYYLTAEESYLGESVLYSLNTGIALPYDTDMEPIPFVYPNPATSMVRIECTDFSAMEVYDLQGILRQASTDKEFYFNDLPVGVYILVVKNNSGERVLTERLIIE